MYKVGNNILKLNGNIIQLLPKVPTVSTTALSNLSYTTASGGGNVTDDGYLTVTERGICYSTGSTPTISGAHTHDSSGLGSFTSSLTGLTNNKLYYVRAYATNSMGTAYGNQVTGNTLAYIVPSVTTNTPTIVGATSVTAYGNVTSDGGSSITDRGFAWGTGNTPTISGSHIHVAGTTGSYSGTITGLTAGVTYYVRAFAINSIGTTYGTAVSFSTYTWTGLQYYWRMDENTGTNLNPAKGSLSGTTTGGSWKAGKKNYAVEVTGGTASYIMFGTAGAINYQHTDKWSYGFWFKRNRNGAVLDCLLSNGTANMNAGFIDCYIYDGGKLWISVEQDNGNYKRLLRYSSNDFCEDTTSWHHLLVTYDGSNNATGLNAYLDGQSVSLTGTGTSIDGNWTSGTLNVGNRYLNNTGYYSGLIDEIAIWNTELAQSDATILYNSGNGIFY